MIRLPIVILACLLLLGASAGAQERLEPVAKDATVFGYKLHYLEAGRGEPIILLHGSGGEGARCGRVAAAAAPVARILRLIGSTIDTLPGY